MIRTETTNSETKGQLEFLLNLLYKGGDQDGRQTSDNEQDNDDVKKKKETNFQFTFVFSVQEDQDIMEADLDSSDRLRATEQELSGEKLIDIQYTSQIAKSSLDSIVLNRPVTPGQLRQSQTTLTVQTLTQANENEQKKAEINMYRSQSNGFESTTKESISPDEQDKPLDSHRSNSLTSNSSFFELNQQNA